MSGENIPAGEFSVSHGTTEWFRLWFEHDRAFKKIEAIEARLKLSYTDLPSGGLIYLNLVRGIECCREKETKIALQLADVDETTLSGQLKAKQLMKSLVIAIRQRSEVERYLGEKLANAIISGIGPSDYLIERISEFYRRHQKPDLFELWGLPIDTDKKTLSARILRAYRELLEEWFQPGETWRMCTKGALKERVLKNNPELSMSEKGFRECLVKLGLDHLPNRTRKNKGK